MTEIATGTHQKPLRPKIALRGSRGVYKRGNTWVAIAELPPGATGERRRRWSGGHRTRKEAERALVAQRNEIANGIDIAPSRLRVDAYLRRWLLSVRPSVQSRTFDLYESVVRNRLIPSLGGHLLDRLSPLIIQETIANWASGARADGREGRLSARSVSLAFTVLKITLTQVVRWNLIARNAACAVTSPRVEKKDAAYVSADQLEYLFAEAERSDALAPVAVAVGLGLRRAELLGLQ